MDVLASVLEVAGVGIAGPAKGKKGSAKRGGKARAGGASGSTPASTTLTVSEAVALCRMLELEFQENGEAGPDMEVAMALLARTRAALGGR